VVAVGAEDFLAERVVAAVIADARKADPGVERRDVDLASETALGTLVEACSPNLFGDAAVVVARNAESADEHMVAALLDAVVHAMGLRRHEHGKHVVFYRLNRDGIRIVRVLHQQMVPATIHFEQ